MTQFLGTAIKGAEAEVAKLILRPSHKQPCIEGWPAAAFNELDAPMQRLDVFSNDQDDLAFTLYADAAPLEPDKEGRIVLPAELAAHAGLADAVVFVGLGRKFEIWETGRLELRRAEARARTLARQLTLPAHNAGAA